MLMMVMMIAVMIDDDQQCDETAGVDFGELIFARSTCTLHEDSDDFADSDGDNSDGTDDCGDPPSGVES